MKQPNKPLNKSSSYRLDNKVTDLGTRLNHTRKTSEFGGSSNSNLFSLRGAPYQPNINYSKERVDSNQKTSNNNIVIKNGENIANINIILNNNNSKILINYR